MQIKIIFIFVLLLVLQSNSYAAKVAIIIDDIGYRKSDINALNLPGDISYAILPHTPFGKSLAIKAKESRHDVILHIPMEAKNGKMLGPAGLTTGMSKQEIQQVLSDAFAEIPFAIGMNNHMGSKLTELTLPMSWTMQFLKARGLVFIDSMTTRDSKAEQVAKNYQVPTLHRHIFLDNQLEFDYIRQQFMQLIHQAKGTTSLVAIAHPHPETMAALNKLIPLLAENNIDLVPISHLLDYTKTTEQTLKAEE